jgi:dihydroorotate dehydrogenase (fumarate)
LFEEQILDEIDAKIEPNDMYFWYPEAAEMVKSISKNQGAKSYLKLIEDARAAVDIPIIASVNCISGKEWVNYAKQIEDAGAQALELNISTIMPGKEDVDCCDIVDQATDIVKSVKSQISIPLAVKINAVPSVMFKLLNSMESAGADALVLFNRAYAPDIDIDAMEVKAENYLSVPEEINDSLRWMGLLAPKAKIDLAASTGIHDHTGAVKQLLAGAKAIQLCSTLYKNELQYLTNIVKGLEDWMARHKFDAVNKFQGKISDNKLNAVQFERTQFLQKNFNK